MKTDYTTVNTPIWLRILREKGVWHLLKRIVYRLIYQPIIGLVAPNHFLFDNVTLPYFRRSYNSTFINERAIEIPIFLELIKNTSHTNLLEVGNVMSHYFPLQGRVVDKYELSPGVLNVDIMDYKPEELHDCIIAISTFEHIGFDDFPQDSGKLDVVINHLLENCLTSKGMLIFSIPIGWNPNLDSALACGKWSEFKQWFFTRTSWLNTWEQNAKPTQEWFKEKYAMYPKGLVIVQIQK